MRTKDRLFIWSILKLVFFGHALLYLFGEVDSFTDMEKMDWLIFILILVAAFGALNDISKTTK